MTYEQQKNHWHIMYKTNNSKNNYHYIFKILNSNNFIYNKSSKYTLSVVGTVLSNSSS